jgi:hypothetical protein
MEQVLTADSVSLDVDGDQMNYPFEKFCVQHPQTSAYTISQATTPPGTETPVITEIKVTPRPVRFYAQTPAPLGVDTIATVGRAPGACVNACPTGYYWDDNGTGDDEQPAPLFDPGWFDISSVPGGSAAAGTQNSLNMGFGGLAAGWTQPATAASANGQIGACRCAPLKEAVLDCGGSPCSSPADIESVLGPRGDCNPSLFWSGIVSLTPVVNVSNSAYLIGSTHNPVIYSLEGSIDGKYPGVTGLTMPGWNAEIPAITALWNYASYVFANAACASPTVSPYLVLGTGLRNNNVWRTVECPDLAARGVTTVTWTQVSTPDANGVPGSYTTFKTCDIDCNSIPTGIAASCPPPTTWDSEDDAAPNPADGP